MKNRPFLRTFRLSAPWKAATELKYLHRRILLKHTFELSHLSPFLVAYGWSERRLSPGKNGSGKGFDDCYVIMYGYYAVNSPRLRSTQPHPIYSLHLLAWPSRGPLEVVGQRTGSSGMPRGCVMDHP